MTNEQLEKLAGSNDIQLRDALIFEGVSFCHMLVCVHCKIPSRFEDAKAFLIVKLVELLDRIATGNIRNVNNLKGFISRSLTSELLRFFNNDHIVKVYDKTVEREILPLYENDIEKHPQFVREPADDVVEFAIRLGLTIRQMEILKLLVDGYDDREVAYRLRVTPATIYNELKIIRSCARKAGFHDSISRKQESLRQLAARKAANRSRRKNL